MKNNNRLLYLLTIIALIWLTVLSFGMPKRSPEKDNVLINQYEVSGFSTDLTKIIEENETAVVTVMTDSSVASGFVYRQIDDTVYILSAYHSIQGAAHISVLFGRSYQESAIMIGYDGYTDLCVLAVKTPYEIRPLKMGDSTLLNKGEFLICIGTPEAADYAGSAQLGMVSLPLLSIDNSATFGGEKHSYYLDVLQFSSGLKEGCSGSPLLNMNGEAVGMVTMALNDDECFALTANEIVKVADLIISDQEVKRNNIGIREVYVRDMENYEKSSLDLNIDTISGIYALKVREGSLAYLAGVRSGDVVKSVNGIELRSLDDYLDVLYGDFEDFEFTVVRNGEELALIRTHD